MKTRSARREAEIAEFWLTHDSADRIDWSAEGIALHFDPDAERPTQTITLRLPRQLARDLHVLAKPRNVSEAALVKMMLSETVAALRREKAV